MLPEYHSTDSENYQKIFANMLEEVFSAYDEIAIYVSSIGDEGGPVGNQMMLAMVLGYLKLRVFTPKTLCLITSDKSILQMIRYELIKTEALEGTLAWDTFNVD